MKKDIKYAAAVESEAQTLETIKAASAAHDVQWLRRPLGEMMSDGIWVHAPTTERSMSELLRTKKIFHRESSSRCLENTSDV